MGRVKSRLARDIGPVAATAFFRHNSARLISQMSADPRWRCWTSVTPDRVALSHEFSSTLGAQTGRIPQGAGNLGQRMQRALEILPPGPAIIIGCDIPGIRPDIIAGAFRALGREDTVFGPAEDGGFWLVGQRRRPRTLKLFGEGVGWGTAHALADTLKGLPAGTGHELVETLSDIDDGADYRRYRRGA